MRDAFCRELVVVIGSGRGVMSEGEGRGVRAGVGRECGLGSRSSKMQSFVEELVLHGVGRIAGRGGNSGRRSLTFGIVRRATCQ